MRRVAYVVSEELVKASSLLPSNKNRSAIVHSLVQAFGLIKRLPGTFFLVRPVPAKKDDLKAYHEGRYVEYLFSASSVSRSSGAADAREEIGLAHDCPPFSGLSDYVQLVAGASLTAVKLLKQDLVDIAINWDGGRHHAHKDHASGFCYVADCTLSLLALRRPMNGLKRNRVMYLDLDLHFSDAVSQAFAGLSSGQILTLSVHHSAPGFFPISHLSSLPDPNGTDPCTLSIPLHRGASDATFYRIWKCIEGIKYAFDPDFVVVQCGVDGLAGDPCGVWNWSLASSKGSFGWYISQVLNWECKVLLLGGGGYNSPNAARAWSYLTSLTLGAPISPETDIPDHRGFPLYGPSFILDIPAGNMRDENTDDYLEEIEEIYTKIAKKVQQLSQL